MCVSWFGSSCYGTPHTGNCSITAFLPPGAGRTEGGTDHAPGPRRYATTFAWYRDRIEHLHESHGEGAEELVPRGTVPGPGPPHLNFGLFW